MIDKKSLLLMRIARLEGQVKALHRMAEKSKDRRKLLILASAVEGAVDGIIVDLFGEYLGSKVKVSKRKDMDIRQTLRMVLKKV